MRMHVHTYVLTNTCTNMGGRIKLDMILDKYVKQIKTANTLSNRVPYEIGRGYCTDSRSSNARLLHRQSIWTKPLSQNRDVRLSPLRGRNNRSPTLLV